MPSTSFGDNDIAGRAALVGRLSSTPGSSVYTAISHADQQLDFLPFGKAEGRHGSARAKNSAQDSAVKTPSVQEANYAVVLTDRMPEPLLFANC
jgi:hypothetical protein